MPNMKIDIQYYIRQVLREQRKVYIPEIGTLILSQTPAYISEDKSEVHPPSIDILFDGSESKDKSLKRYIKETGKYSKSDINAAITSYTQSTFDNLINNNVNHIEQVGTLSQDSVSGKVGFTPSFDAFTKEYKDLTLLPIKPINRIKQDNIVPHAVDTEDQYLRKESKWRWLQPIIAGVLIASLVILSMILMKKCNQTDSMLYNNPNEEVGIVDDTEVLNEKDSFFAEETESEEGENVIDDVTDESAIVNTEDLESKYEEIDALVNDGSRNLATKVDEEIAELKTIDNQLVDEENIEVIETVSIQEDDLKYPGESEVDNIEESITEPTYTQSKYAEIIPSSGKCIIIVASLNKATNITRMISKIERDGKKAYTSQYNGRTRVGFSFDCTEVDLEQYLNDVRKKFATKAWYLDPSLAIPYQ